MKIAMVSEGAGLHAQNLVKNLTDLDGHEFTFYPTHPRAGFKPMPGLIVEDTFQLHQYSHVDWSEVDVLWNMGYFFTVDQLFMQLKVMYPQIKIVNHWIGTDILYIAQFLASRPLCKHCFLSKIDLHLVDDYSFQQELHNLFYLETLFVPTLPEHPMPLTPLPEEFAVGVYLPFYKRDFYRFNDIFKVAMQLPDIPFYVFSLDKWEMEGVPENIQFTEYIPPEKKEEVWGLCSVFISVPIHGGLGITAIEMEQMGRDVITDKEYPHTHRIESLIDMVGVIKKLKAKSKLNKKGSEFYHQEYSVENLQKYTLEALAKLE